MYCSNLVSKFSFLQSRVWGLSYST